MAKSEAHESSIRRVELTEKFLRIYLKFSNQFDSAIPRKFLLITYSKDLDKTKIYEGKVPKKNSSFVLQSIEIDHTISQASFEGNPKGGEIQVPLEILKPLDRFFIQIETNYDLFEESDWIQIDHSHESTKKEFLSKTIGLIPCYNAEKFIKQVALETLDHVGHLIVVDDGSTDRSGFILEELLKHYKHKMEVVHLTKNMGKGFALLEGFKKALEQKKFSILVALDADGQHRPTDILYLAKAIDDGADLSIGARLFRLMPFRSKFSNAIISFLLKGFYSGAPKDTQSGMRAFSKKFLQEIVGNIQGGAYEYEFSILLFALENHKKIISIPITTLYIEKNRSSHFSPVKDSFKIIKVFISHLCNRFLKVLGLKK